eukprot:1551266-Amphidinium_carterae.1
MFCSTNYPFFFFPDYGVPVQDGLGNVEGSTDMGALVGVMSYEVGDGRTSPRQAVWETISASRETKNTNRTQGNAREHECKTHQSHSQCGTTIEFRKMVSDIASGFLSSEL